MFFMFLFRQKNRFHLTCNMYMLVWWFIERLITFFKSPVATSLRKLFCLTKIHNFFKVIEGKGKRTRNEELMAWVIQYSRLLIKRTQSLKIVVYFPYLIFYSKKITQ